MQPPDLRYIAKSTILKYLVCSSDISRDHLVMLEYFESFGQGVFGDEILSQIIEDFPGELTDELLLVLSPPHLRHLKLTRCSRLSCSGLQKAIAKCQQLQALDFSECIHLLHPTVFCCLKDKAFNLVSLSLENSQVVSDDIVQVALMCCPGLKHLNLSSCRNITDTAFALSNSELSSASSTATTNSPSSKNPSHPGSNITSVDISGCQSLSTTTVKYLVGLCGAKLKTINLAWTGVDCTALLYLAGLNMEEVARIVHETDHTSANLAKKAIKHACSSSMGSPMHIPSIKDSNLTQLQNQNSAACGEENDHELQNEFFWSESFQNLTQDSHIVSQTYLFPARPPEVFAEDLHDCDESLLNEIELLRLKDVIPVTYMSSLEVEHCQQFNESSDEESDDSFKTASEEFDLITYSLSEELETSIPISEERNASHEESLETQESYNTDHDKCGDSGVLKYARDLCWNVPAGNHSTSNLLDIDSCKDVCASSDDTLLSCAQGESSRELENVTCIRNPAVILLSGEQSQEGFAEEIYEDCFDIESHPVMSCKEDQCFYQSSVRTCSLESSTCDDAVMSYIAVNENEPNCPIIPCEKAEEEEVKCDKSGYPIMPCAKVNQAESEWQNMPCENVIDMESEYPIEPCAKMNLKECDYPVMLSEKVMDDKVQCKSLGIQCMVGVEQDCPVTLDVKSTGNGQRYPNMSCTDNEGQKASTHTVKSHSHEKREGYKHTIKPCWEDTGFVIPKATSEKETDRKSSELSFECSLTETKRSRSSDCMSSHSRVLQVADLLQTQMYQPQITSLDITDICYQNKPLGEACLKVFSKACNHLKNLTVSWTGLDDKMLTYLLRNERELESLSLVDCENLSNISVSTIPVYCPKLSSFDLKGMCYVTDHGVMPLTRSNDLKTLCLAEAAITDSTLESIAKGCGGKLSVLDISWCEDITDRGMSIIANSCPSLQHLGLRQCAASHLTLNALVAKCHLISSLNIAGVESLTDTALSSMAENMPLLREIDASWNSSLSDIGISALLECCTRLNKAVLCGLKRITSQPFLAIIGDLGRWYLLEQLCKYNRRSPSSVSEGKLAVKVCDSETAKSLGDQIPCRSMAYAPSLRQVLLEYSDKVNDDHLSAIVAVCRGTLFIKDYYRQPVEPKWIFRS